MDDGCRWTHLRSPMYAVPVSEKASEYPQIVHWNVTTARPAKLRYSMLSALLRLNKPA